MSLWWMLFSCLDRRVSASILWHCWPVSSLYAIKVSPAISSLAQPWPIIVTFGPTDNLRMASLMWTGALITPRTPPQVPAVTLTMILSDHCTWSYVHPSYNQLSNSTLSNKNKRNGLKIVISKSVLIWIDNSNLSWQMLFKALKYLIFGALVRSWQSHKSG